MPTALKIFLIICALLVVAFLLFFIGALILSKPPITNTYEVTEDFSGIYINTLRSDIRILPTEESKAKVVCVENEARLHTVTISDGTLKIEEDTTSAWYDFISPFPRKETVSLYLPYAEYGALNVSALTSDVSIAENFSFEEINVAVSTGDVNNSASSKGDLSITATTGDVINNASAYGDLRITTTTGDVALTNTNAKSLSLSLSTGTVSVSNASFNEAICINVQTGDISLADVSCASLNSSGTTGDILLTKTAVSGKLAIERSTGDVKLNFSDAGEIEIATDTGDVTGTLLTPKIFFTDTSTGHVEVPKYSSANGTCTVTTSTGNIIFSVD